MTKLVKLNDRTAIDLDDVVCALVVEDNEQKGRFAVRVYFKSVADVMILYDEAAQNLMGHIAKITVRKPKKEANDAVLG